MARTGGSQAILRSRPESALLCLSPDKTRTRYQIPVASASEIGDEGPLGGAPPTYRDTHVNPHDRSVVKGQSRIVHRVVSKQMTVLPYLTEIIPQENHVLVMAYPGARHIGTLELTTGTGCAAR